MVLATNRPWWLTANGVWPGSKWLKAASGTIVSLVVLTGEREEGPSLPGLGRALRASLPSTFLPALELIPDDPGPGRTGFRATVPAAALVIAVPRGLAPEVLT